ncbi:MAG: rubrerythrin family protein [Dehalococcoidia bacterium]|nr:MAG: rubrerythrin family protein [Dehalococcoidia bacterium]
MSKTDENLRIAFADESQTNIEYLAYAHKAMDEGLMDIAQLFSEAAGAETVHALSHLQAMGVVRTTRENLEEASEGEDLDISSIYPKFIEEARSEGREEAVKSFTMAFKREKHHRTMFRQALRQLA